MTWCVSRLRNAVVAMTGCMWRLYDTVVAMTGCMFSIKSFYYLTLGSRATREGWQYSLGQKQPKLFIQPRFDAPGNNIASWTSVWITTKWSTRWQSLPETPLLLSTPTSFIHPGQKRKPLKRHFIQLEATVLSDRLHGEELSSQSQKWVFRSLTYTNVCSIILVCEKPRCFLSS